MKPLLAALFLAACSPLCAANAEFTQTRGWLHVNGYTHHFDAPGANDQLWGAGFTWYTRTYGPMATAWEADVFQDSGRKLCAYAGGSLTTPTRWGNFGVTGALMYH